jgi:hypothetical protein
MTMSGIKILIPSAACLALLCATCVSQAEQSTSPEQRGASSGAVPAGFSSDRIGDIHDFDYLLGAWTTQQKRLKARGIGKSEWIEAPANRHCAVSYLGGLDIVEDSWSPTGTPAGLFLYTFNPQKKQWAIRWVNPKTGEPDPPSVGGFAGTRGEFYGEDTDNGRAIKVRITWTRLDHDHARWEQSFSYDNQTWETNWITDFTRADPAAVCRKT